MPLSEEELRLLEQMERALAAEDPKFVSALQGRTLERSARLRAIAAGVAFVVGMALLLGGVAMVQQVWLSVIGFLVMLASATFGLTAWRGRHAPHDHGHDHGHEHVFDETVEGRNFQVIDGGKRTRRNRRPKSSRGSGGFMHRIEERWTHRRDQGL